MNKRTMKKGLAIVLALVMVFAMTTTAFAVSGIPNNNGTYLEGTAIPPSSTDADCSAYVVTTPETSTNANVTLVVEAGNAYQNYSIKYMSNFREVLNVNLSSSIAKNFTVYDVVNAANTQYSDKINFHFKENTTIKPYVDYITHGGYKWQDAQLGFDGWVFRVNDKFPVVKTEDNVGYMGTTMEQTYVKDGDVVHFFYDFPSYLEPNTPSLAAGYVRAQKDSFSANSLTVQLQEHKTDIAPEYPYIMSINNYENSGYGISAVLYDMNGNQVATGRSNNAGKVTFSGKFASGETYIVQTVKQMLSLDEEDEWYDTVDSVLLERTGAYSKITL